MTNDEVRKLLEDAPFMPFSIHTAGGKSFKIEHPDFAILTRGGRILVLEMESEARAFIDVMLATHIETHPRK